MGRDDPMKGFEPAFQHPVRLQIGAVLAQAQDAEFAKLREITGVADSVLSKHLSALADAGFVKLSKAALDGRQRTWASFTRAGSKAFAAHVAALQRLAGVAGQSA